MGEVPSQSMMSALNSIEPAESEEHKGNVTKIFSGDIVEGMLSEGIGEIKRSLDVLYHNPGNMEPHTNALACRSITMGHVDNMLHFMGPYSDASLRPRHRAARKVLAAMLRRMGNNAPVKSRAGRLFDGFDITDFARNMVQFMTAFHTVLSVASTKVERNKALKEFCRG